MQGTEDKNNIPDAYGRYGQQLPHRIYLFPAGQADCNVPKVEQVITA